MALFEEFSVSIFVFSCYSSALVSSVGIVIAMILAENVLISCTPGEVCFGGRSIEGGKYFVHGNLCNFSVRRGDGVEDLRSGEVHLLLESLVCARLLFLVFPEEVEDAVGSHSSNTHLAVIINFLLEKSHHLCL